MARCCALNHLAIIKSALGDLDRVERFVKLIGYVNVAPGFTKMPQVVNGASDLLVELWGERGEHARAAVGVASLANDAPVETEVILQIKNQPRKVKVPEPIASHLFTERSAITQGERNCGFSRRLQ